ncbi:hypothetical protein IWZ01DRAFT_213243 [Phyllosticta capitalensis]
MLAWRVGRFHYLRAYGSGISSSPTAIILLFRCSVLFAEGVVAATGAVTVLGKSRWTDGASECWVLQKVGTW